MIFDCTKITNNANSTNKLKITQKFKYKFTYSRHFQKNN